MKRLICLLAMLSFVSAVFPQASSPQRVVIDVGNPAAVERFLAAVRPLDAPRRVTIDLGNPLVAEQFVLATNPAAWPDNRVVIDVGRQSQPAPPLAGAQEIPWETQQVLYTLTGQDSFLVRSSRSGCPGTDVKPSVSVAYATKSGWSNPPIRFGPLNESTTCPLGKGYTLDVSALGVNAPRVRLNEPGPDLYSGRK